MSQQKHEVEYVDEKRNRERRLLQVVMQYLSEHNYTTSLGSLEAETGVIFDEEDSELVGGGLLSHSLDLALDIMDEQRLNPTLSPEEQKEKDILDTLVCIVWVECGWMVVVVVLCIEREREREREGGVM